jgi:hypothetical protein
MPDFTISLTDVQVKIVRRMDANMTARQVLQAHLDTWLAPEVAKFVAEDREGVKSAYIAADPIIQAKVRELLKLA